MLPLVNVVPVTELIVMMLEFVVIKPKPDSLTDELLLVKVSELPPVEIVPVILIEPVLVTCMLPEPVCEIPLMVRFALLVKFKPPAPLLDALKVETALLPLVNIVPVTELVMSVPVVVIPAL